jgi:hypothetical protein
MSTGTAMAPGNLYVDTFLYFQRMFANTKGDVSQVQLASYLPDWVYSDRDTLGRAVTGALMAMFEHRVKGRGDWEEIPFDQVHAFVATMPPELHKELDEIILAQAKIVGNGLIASDVVLFRVLKWEREDRAKTVRWLRALDKAARVLQRMVATPLNDPFLREHKKAALEQLRPALIRFQKQFRAKNIPDSEANEDNIVKAFAAEARDPLFPFLSNAHNFKLWMDFCKSDPYIFLTMTPESLFDAFVGWVTIHDSVYAKKVMSSGR